MKDQLKQRITGLLLLILLAAILSPLLFRDQGDTREPLDLSIPPSPTLTEVDAAPLIDAEQVRALQAEIERDRRTVTRKTLELETDDSEQDVTIGSSTKTETEPFHLGSWAVRLTSFTSYERASILAAQLREAHYHAYVQSGQEGETVYHVLAGPQLTRQDAQRLQQRLRYDREFQLEGVLVPVER